MKKKPKQTSKPLVDVDLPGSIIIEEIPSDSYQLKKANGNGKDYKKDIS